MNNEELFDAIAFTWQSAENANKGYSVANNDRARLMYDHLKELLAVQLERAKKGYDVTITCGEPIFIPNADKFS
jgi:hypothetical protein